MNPNIQVKVVTLAANQTLSVQATGSYLVLQAATGSFNFAIDGGVFQTGLVTIGIDVFRDRELVSSPKGIAAVPQQFKEIILQDTSGQTNAITIVVANSPVTYFSPTPTVFQKDAPTSTVGSGIISLGAGATQDFPGTSGGKTRHQFIVTNMDASNPIYILDSTSTVGAVVYPQRSWTITSISGDIKVKNPNGGSVNIAVMNTYYN